MHFPRAMFLRIVAAVLVALTLGPSPSTRVDAEGQSKLDPLLQEQAGHSGRSRVILRLPNAGALSPVTSLLPLLGGQSIKHLPLINGVVLDLPNAALAGLANNPLVDRISMDRVVAGAMERTGAATGAAAARQTFGLNGSGVGIAIIDSGVAPSHDDLADPASGTSASSASWISSGGHPAAYDDYGHGTHVAGIIGGNGSTPAARDRASRRPLIWSFSRCSTTRAGPHQQRDRGARVCRREQGRAEHPDRQPVGGDGRVRVLQLRSADARRAPGGGRRDRRGRCGGQRRPRAAGSTQYGGITAPGNAPVGADGRRVEPHGDRRSRRRHDGRVQLARPRRDRLRAKPDLVAPGVGIESLTDPASQLYMVERAVLLNGTVPTSYLPYHESERDEHGGARSSAARSR